MSPDQQVENTMHIIHKLSRYFARALKKDSQACNNPEDAQAVICAYIGFFGSYYEYLLSCAGNRQEITRDKVRSILSTYKEA